MKLIERLEEYDSLRSYRIPGWKGNNRVIFENEDQSNLIADLKNWNMYRRKQYQVKIQKALPDKVYNVSGRPGVVYNILEDCEESVAAADYIVAGLLGEMWPISQKDLCGYDADVNEIDEIPKLFHTKPSDKTYYGILIPVTVPFSVETGKYGRLNGNAKPDEIPHGQGDYIICTSFDEGDYRIVNGQIFNKMYELQK